MSKINRVKVVIDEIVYELTSPEPIEYIQSVASYIDRKIKNIYSVKSEASINPRLKTLFVSLNIADDLFKERLRADELEATAKLFEDTAKNLESEGQGLKTRNQELEREIAALKEDLVRTNTLLNEYMEALEVEKSIVSDSKVTKINR